MQAQRIEALDGFRAIAVLGVLWAHIWMFLGNPPYVVFKINIASYISFFGTGVDLFFVISGFCMYLMYITKVKSITFSNYLQYLKKRWLRIAPAFYFAAFAYGIYQVDFVISRFDWEYWLKLILFVINLQHEKTKYGPHFWSLGTEWHFYLLLPLIAVGVARFFKVSIAIILSLCIALRLFFWVTPGDVFNVINYSVFNRLIEFIMGMVAARLYFSNNREWYKASHRGILLGVLLAATGRILMSSGFHLRTDALGVVARVFDLPLLSAGYAIIILNTLSYKSVLRSILETKFVSLIGKYSYSMYLWHWIISLYLVKELNDLLSVPAFLKVNILFVISLIVLLPISLTSYILFERFYFLKKRDERGPIGEKENSI